MKEETKTEATRPSEDEAQERLFNPEDYPQVIGHGHLDDGEPFDIIQGPPRTEVLPRTLSACFANGRTIPFHGHTLFQRVELSTTNFDFGEVVASGYGRVYRGEFMYGFLFGNLQDALEKVRRILEWLDHWCLLEEWTWREIRRKVLGRPVWYREQPAVVRQYNSARGQVTLVPDENIDTTEFKAPPWDTIGEKITEAHEDLLSEHIRWYREE